MQIISIDDIKPAKYNPRIMTEDKRRELEKSIKMNGFCIPILVNKANNVIIAGHQRTTAAKAIGIKEVPCYLIEGITDSDEVLFNQLHNGTDHEKGCVCKATKEIADGFSEQPNSYFEIENAKGAVVKEICKLLLRYGNVLTLVLMGDTSVIGANYAYACQLLDMPVNVSKIKYGEEEKRLLQDKYGEFSYEHLRKNTWVQGLAQMHRTSRNDTLVGRKKANASVLYEDFVLKEYESIPHESILDFGCGKGYYIARFKTPVHLGVEFYNNNGTALNTAKTNRQIDELIKYGKQFDIVVCDSVLNSTDSIKAENSIMSCLNLFCKTGGCLFISGRRMDSAVQENNADKAKNLSRKIVFLDKDGFTGIYRQGNWYYQKYHTEEMAKKVVESHGFEILTYHETSSSWKIVAKKINNLTNNEYCQAVDFEFDLPLPNGSYKRNGDVKKAYGLI